MSLTFRKATTADLDAIAAIYERIHDEEAALARGELYVEEAAGRVTGAAILNHQQVDVYTGAPWQIAAADDEVLVMHTLTIDPAAKGRGLGTAFAAFYERRARELGCTALRIDTNKRNTPALSLYRKLGYSEIDIVPCQFNGIDGVELVLLEKAVQ